MVATGAYPVIRAKVPSFSGASACPEKFSISLEKPQVNSKYNVLQGVVEDVVYQGDHTKYWVNIGEDWRIAITRQHSRFMLDEKPITWNDKVFLYWFADDGFMLDQYSEADEELLQMPPQAVGDTIEQNVNSTIVSIELAEKMGECKK